jgi:hypothetical protein
LLSERAPEQRGLVERAIEQHEKVVTLLAQAKVATDTWQSKGDAEGPELACALGALMGSSRATSIMKRQPSCRLQRSRSPWRSGECCPGTLWRTSRGTRSG